MLFSLIKIITWKVDNNLTEVEIENINEIIVNDQVDPIESLKGVNKYTIGWLKVNNTKVDYPFVQYKDNDYYLTHSFENKKSEAGWIFMDYRSNPNFEDQNTVIYGHNRLNGSMFGSLKQLNKKYNKNYDYLISVTTSDAEYTYKIFSIYRIKTTSDYLKTNFKNETDYKNFLKLLTKRSTFNLNTKVDATDKILTLSTCDGSKHKLVVHGKLIKLQYK